MFIIILQKILLHVSIKSECILINSVDETKCEIYSGDVYLAEFYESYSKLEEVTVMHYCVQHLYFDIWEKS